MGEPLGPHPGEGGGQIPIQTKGGREAGSDPAAKRDGTGSDPATEGDREGETEEVPESDLGPVGEDVAGSKRRGEEAPESDLEEKRDT